MATVSGNPQGSRPAPDGQPAIGARVLLVEMDEVTGAMRCRRGYRAFSTAHTGRDGVPVVHVVTDADWERWLVDLATTGPLRSPDSLTWPAELVWPDGGPR